MNDDTWYGNGPKPDNRVYGNLDDSNETFRWVKQLKTRQEERERKLLEQYPNLKALDDEIADMEDDMRHRQMSLDNLKEERLILRRLLGVK